MRKSDLKTGMLIVNRQGKRGIVMRGTERGDHIVSNNEDIVDESYDDTWFPMKYLTDDLKKDGYGKSSDIVKVYSLSCNINGASLSLSDRELLWEREPSIDIDIKINGKDANLSDISRETLLKLREEN